MAEGKKAFIVYTDWLKYTDEMTIEQKGLWIDWCLKYCNDLNPSYPNDPVSKMLCIMCKDILKRDLKKYEEKKERFMKIGKQYNNNDNENEQKTLPNTETNTKPKSECVNSNKLIVNSNKCISNDILNNACACEENEISKLQALIQQIEIVFGRNLTNAETMIIQDFKNKGLTDESIINDLNHYVDKANPIAYMKKMIENATIHEKVYQDDLKGSAWLDNFNKQWEGK